MIGREDTAKRGGGILKKALAASLLAAALVVPALVVPASAADSVRKGRTIEAFIGTNLLDIQGYPAGKSVRVDVLRNGVRVGSATGVTGTRGANRGFLEINHAGGGQFPRGDCFKPPVTPDVMPGDRIQTKVAGEIGTDSATVRDVFLDTEATEISQADDTITVFGHVRSTPDAPINPRRDVLELRLNANDFTWDVTKDPADPLDEGRKDLREQLAAAEIQPDGTFTHVFEVSDADADNAADPALGIEQAFEWSRAVGEAAGPPAIFVSDAPEAGALPRCPPVAEYAVTNSNPSKLDALNIGGGLRLAGISKDATAVSVRLDDRNNAATRPVVLDARVKPAYVEGFQTWRTVQMTTADVRRLRRLDDGNLTATGTFTVPGNPNPESEVLTIRKNAR